MSAPLARADNACRFIEQASLDISHAAGSAAPTVDGEINGRPVRMLLDTGSDATLVLRAEADNQGLNPERTSRQVQGVGGRTSLFLVKVKDFAIGGAHAKNMRFPVVDSLENSGMAGIVGDDFLLQYDLELDFSDKRIKLFRADHCQDKALAYWDKDASSVPMKFSRGSTKPLVQVHVNGVALWALIDSGSDSTVIDLDVARKLGFSTEAPGVVADGTARGIGSETRTVWHQTFDSFAIGDEVIQHPRIGVMDSPADYIGRKEHQVILGRDFLQSHHVLLSQSQMLFYFSYLGGPVFPKSPVDGARL
ncbi:aspartyl protease family protein [Massilia sp. S19_KUP03_FR1]|uniref:aspartyl protease family protein n=1 Tax=Massilia sp. S19_KUP03_FR1 TaxID=3025503 RepID=UPI002FCDC052